MEAVSPVVKEDPLALFTIRVEELVLELPHVSCPGHLQVPVLMMYLTQ